MSVNESKNNAELKKKNRQKGTCDMILFIYNSRRYKVIYSYKK